MPDDAAPAAAGGQDSQERHDAEVVATVAHELRTPLMAIRGFARLIADGGLDADEARDFAVEIHDTAVRLSGYVDAMLEEAALSRGRVQLRMEPVDLGALTQEVLRSLSSAAGPDHALVGSVPDDLPRVIGDPDRLRQVLVNLVANAIKYSPDGGRVVVSGEARADDVVLWVADDGIGIPEAERERVFEPFHRVNSEATRGIKGTGLGLGIVRGLLELHGGSISAGAGAEGHGTVMRATLPAAAPGIDEATPPAPGRESSTVG